LATSGGVDGARADVYVGGPPNSGGKPDNFEHTFCWGFTFGDADLRDAATFAMGNLDTQTLYFDTGVACSSATDVIWESEPALGARGDWTCLATNAVGECERSRVRLNPTQLANNNNRRKTACHEGGHSVGLTHVDNGDDCMRNGAVNGGFETYNAHHVSHMNDSQDSPFGTADSIARVPGGIRVAGWSIDPDLRLNANQVHVVVDVTVFNLGNAAVGRPDVGAAFPYWGANHGFDTVLPVTLGPNNVCVWAINAAGTAGANRFLRCQFVP